MGDRLAVSLIFIPGGRKGGTLRKSRSLSREEMFQIDPSFLDTVHALLVRTPFEFLHDVQHGAKTPRSF